MKFRIILHQDKYWPQYKNNDSDWKFYDLWVNHDPARIWESRVKFNSINEVRSFLAERFLVEDPYHYQVIETFEV